MKVPGWKFLSGVECLPLHHNSCFLSYTGPQVNNFTYITSSTKHVTDLQCKMYNSHFNTESTHTCGDVRGMYLKCPGQLSVTHTAIQ